ncbi:MAG: site-2 protease family protein [Oscillospiraceae bacterium]|jgi:Zn-dependent protease|nr:site-2 protease family protein [Oscillospiraceae bacterium]
MLSQLLRGGFSEMNMADLLLHLAAVCFIVFCTLPVHEAAHAWMAKKLGDNTAWMHGRLTLNPMKHIDWMGALLILLVGFGYAKPVPVNPRNFNNPKRDMALVALAGPVSNLMMGLVLCFLSTALYVVAGRLGSEFISFVSSFFYSAAFINVSLAVFNLIPIPPLDGSRILNVLLPDRLYWKVMRYEGYLRIGILLLLLLGVLTAPLMWLTNLIMSGFFAVTALPFAAQGFMSL